MYNKKTLVVSVLAVAFVSSLVFGVFINETWAGYGSTSGIAPVGGTMYSVPILYDAKDWGLMGFYQDTISGVDFGFGVMAMIWSYNNASKGEQCATGFQLVGASNEPQYHDVCWNDVSRAWYGPHGDVPADSTRQFRIVNVITNDINNLSDVAQQ